MGQKNQSAADRAAQMRALRVAVASLDRTVQTVKRTHMSRAELAELDLQAQREWRLQSTKRYLRKSQP